jgi:hypothetical protein
MGCGRAFCAEMHKLVNIFALANCRSCVTPPRTQKSLFHLPCSKFHQDPEWEETSPSVKLELSDIRSMCFVKFCYFLKLGGGGNGKNFRVKYIHTTLREKLKKDAMTAMTDSGPTNLRNRDCSNSDVLG